MSRSLKVRRSCIERVKLSVKRNGFMSQRALAEDVELSLATVSNFLTGRPVDRATFVELCDRLSLDVEAIADLGADLSADADSDHSPSVASHPPSSPTAIAIPRRHSWGEALDVTTFYGREKELVQIRQWVMDDQCRLVTLIGMGGMGKTTLGIRFAEQVQDEFDAVMWRSLRNAPPVQELLADLIGFLCHQPAAIPPSIDGQIAQLMDCLRTSRCLLILDNGESILGSGQRAGAYRDGY